MVHGERSTKIPIEFRSRSQQLFVSFEAAEGDILDLLISTHPDLSDEIDKLLAPYGESIDAL